MKNKKYSSSVWGRIGIFVLSLIAFSLTLLSFAVGSPEGAIIANAGVAWPFGNVDLQQPVFAATLAVTITDHFTILDPGILTGAMTCNLTIDKNVRAGALLFLEITTTATETFTPGTGFTAPAFAGVSGKTKCQMLVYDGVTFKPSSVAFQID
jgi:hypothetical protein